MYITIVILSDAYKPPSFGVNVLVYTVSPSFIYRPPVDKNAASVLNNSGPFPASAMNSFGNQYVTSFLFLSLPVYE